MKSQQQALLSLGLVALAALLASVSANPVTSDSAASGNERSLFADSKSTIPRYRWAFQQPSDELLSSLRDRILLVRPMPRFPYTRKRSCFINAGMNNNCDFKDYLSAASARRIWQSPNSPGKRSSSSASSGPVNAELISYYYNQNQDGANQDSDILDVQPQASAQSGPVKRMQCISGLPGGDCENSFLGGESLGQDFLRPGGRNPGRR